MDVLIELCVFNLKSANGRIAQLIHKQKYSTNNYLAVEILISDKFLVMNFQRDKDVKLPGKMYDCLIQVRSTSNFELIYSVKELEGIKPVFLPIKNFSTNLWMANSSKYESFFGTFNSNLIINIYFQTLGL